MNEHEAFEYDDDEDFDFAKYIVERQYQKNKGKVFVVNPKKMEQIKKICAYFKTASDHAKKFWQDVDDNQLPYKITVDMGDPFFDGMATIDVIIATKEENLPGEYSATNYSFQELAGLLDNDCDVVVSPVYDVSQEKYTGALHFEVYVNNAYIANKK